MIELIEKTSIVYSLRHPKTGSFWNGSFHQPTFTDKPHRWGKRTEALRRYADYLVEFDTKSSKDSWANFPPVLVLVEEQLTIKPLSSELLSPIDGDNLVLSKAQRVLCSHDYENFRALVRRSGATTYQFMVEITYDFLSKLRSSKSFDYSRKNSLVECAKQLGHQRARVIGSSIFVKNEKDLLMLKMKGEIEIDYVYDLFRMEKITG